MTAGWTSLPWLHTLRQPTLVLTGDDDPAIPVTNGRILARLIPDSRLVVLPGAGHLFLAEEADTVAPLIAEFLADPTTATDPTTHSRVARGRSDPSVGGDLQAKTSAGSVTAM